MPADLTREIRVEADSLPFTWVKALTYYTSKGPASQSSKGSAQRQRLIKLGYQVETRKEDEGVYSIWIMQTYGTEV